MESPRWEFQVNLSNTPFDLAHTLDSGQAFRWAQKGDWWQGVLPGGVLKVKQEDKSLFCVASSELVSAKIVNEYFRLDESLDRVYSRIMKDDHVNGAVQRYYGLRLIDQDVWECLLSFVIATNANIPRIKLMVSNICEKFGRTQNFEGNPYHLFPDPESLAGATIDELASCGLGYRARFVKSVAEKVCSRSVDFDELRLANYERAKEMLIERLLGEKTFLGVGRKAADCILLFSCKKDSAFPIDVWMARVLARFYPRLFEKETAKRLESHVSRQTKISGGQYDEISASMRDYFGEYAGYAQQYLFHDARKGGLE